tara:strand:- start:318 stop:617 length:300 start_codon:yes stop_codon:yes gene_type:complete
MPSHHYGSGQYQKIVDTQTPQRPVSWRTRLFVAQMSEACCQSKAPVTEVEQVPHDSRLFRLQRQSRQMMNILLYLPTVSARTKELWSIATVLICVDRSA